MENKESGELIFLRYVFPVIGYCNKLPVDAREILEFEKMMKEGGIPSRKRLEELFPKAVMHLKSWEPEDVRDYWCIEHNKIVGDENPFCKVYGFSVVDVKEPQNGEVCRARFGAREYHPSYIELKKGDFFTLHRSVAEKLTPEQFEKYFPEIAA